MKDNSQFVDGYSEIPRRWRIEIFYALVSWAEKVRLALWDFVIDKYEARIGLSILRGTARRVAPDENFTAIANQLINPDNLDPTKW